ncbi:hemin ABC transporter substrate-binding protein, partial [bacterium M00.F.Ca.ET.222.01.1.1]
MVSFPSLSRPNLAPAIGLSLLLAVLPVRAEEAATVFADTSKIVAIGGSITEIVYALGEEDHLVARD